MPWIKWLFLLILLCFVPLECEVYQDRPKIKTLDGNLYLQPALDKNIYLVPNGPKSSIFVGDTNLIEAKNDNSDIKTENQNQPVSGDLDQILNGPNGILRRLEKLENKDTVIPSELLFNISTISRKVHTLNRKVLNLQNQINNGGKDECQSNPCKHGGTCLNLANGYYCLCPNNWERKDCDVDVNECRNFAGTDLGCQNGATCINRPGSYECLCRSGWFGLHCTRKEKDCSGGNFEMCGHGTCVQVSSGVGIQCICHQGWTTNGTDFACLTDINECESSHGCSVNPKVSCINLPGSFRCGQCPPGYEGDGFRCSDVDECTTIPNGGCSSMVTCYNTIGSRICGPCPPGYQGDGITCTWRGSCNINHGGCHPSAQCIELAGTQIPQCICPEGMNGDGLGISGCYVSANFNNTVDCGSNPCGSHGQCHNLRNGYTCICYKGYGGAHCDLPMDYCATNPCHNGGTCRPDMSTTRGFRCECTAQFSGQLCQVRFKTCGGLLDSEEGSIVYPLSNNTMYSHNSQCAWVIRTIPEKVINVTFTKFDLEESGPDCSYDFLQIHDGPKSSSQLIGRYCGNNFPKGGNILSSHNNIYFWFHSDKSVAKSGFALHWTSVDPVCGGDVDASTHGQISSPGSPGPYPPNRDCYWNIRAPLGKRLSLHFYALDIETHTNCSFDYLAIYDGEHDTDPLLNRYCSSTQPAPIQSSSSDMLIHFHSDAYSSGTGFQISYAPVDGIPGCGGYFTTDLGEITSPSYNGKYLNNVICEYKIKAGPDTKIKLDFKSFKLESSMRCRLDYLKIYDGPSENSPFVGKFCGNTYPHMYTSSSNTLYLKFVSDRSLGSHGFRIAYKTICEKTILGDSGIITSPGYPFTYPHNKICVYIISTNPGKAIQLSFQQFDLEDNSRFNCRFDNVEIRDGSNANATLLGKYCSGRIPPVQTSTHNYMYIKFTSDMSVAGAGFYANYTTINTECGGIHRESTGLINFPSGDINTYKNDQKCSWELIAPEGMIIKLSWNRFDVEDMPQCRSDYLEVIEIDENNENNVLGRFCGSHTPPAVTTSTNRLVLKFHSDNSIRSLGFSVSYTFLDEKSHCDRMYIKSHGFIYSPGWPKTYSTNRDCTWVISVPVGQQILLNISQFNLERPIRNKCDLGDYLEIRNGATINSPLIGQYCGSFQNRQIKSLANVVYLHFHSDFYLTGTGFKIEWDGTITGCGGTLTSSSGSISSPNYPNSYNDNAECFYKIVTSSGSRIQISFTDLDLERTPHCTDDYVEIYDGRDANAPSLGRHCSMSPSAARIETSTNFVFIKFRSDLYRNAKGFMLNYNTICNNNLTGRYGVIESPGYPDSYPTSMNCLWNINVPKGNKINITFTHFDIFKRQRYYYPWNGHKPCGDDYLQTKEPDHSDFSDKTCGNVLPRSMRTKSNSLLIKFVTGSYTPRTGFRLEWLKDGCGGHIQKSAGKISLENIPAGDELECQWLIETRMGTSVTITFSTIHIKNSINCTTDAIEIYNGRDISAPMISKNCHQEIVSVQSDSNFMLIRFRKQSYFKDAHFRANFRSSQAKCGGYLHTRSGTIQSKNYPQNYENNMDCYWFISVPPTHRIEINIIDLDLYSISNDYNDIDSCGDSIKIFDGTETLDANYTLQICPNSNISQIITKSNNAVVRFQSDSHGTAKGFRANFSAACGAIINAEYDGTITNRQFVSHTNTSCIWTIIAPTPDQKISFTLKHLSVPLNYDVATNRKCPSSFLRIFDGNDNSAPLIDEYCGRKVPPTVVSHGSALTIELGSYTDRVMGLFVAHYSSLNNTCGGKITAEMGSIASPNYPEPYPGDADCEWTINSSPGSAVYMTVEKLDLESSYKCNEDYLEIRENNGAGRLIGVYCGNEIPSNSTSASKIYIKFHSNSRNSGQGFILHYGYLHDNALHGDSGEITSPLYPLPYHGSGEFTWRIFLSESETISVVIDRFLLPSFSETSYNTLSVYDGYDTTETLLGEFQGALNVFDPSKILQTSSNVVFIKLTMDESNSGSLFHIKWAKASRYEELSETSQINCGSNETKLVKVGESIYFTSPNYPKDYKNDLNCEWIFRAQLGRHLKISLIDFKLEESHLCFADSVSIYSSETAASWRPVKENICLSTSANEGANSTTYMKVKFKTDSSITKKGFAARVFSKCGGIITEKSSEISVSWFDFFGYDNVAVREPKCDWVVKVRPGRNIKVEFIHFNITNTNDKCTTFVTLRNGDSVEAPLLGNAKYCGYSHENKTGIVTSSNELFISFSRPKDFYIAHFQNFILRYEENNIECGLTSKLTSDHSWEIISSPNYPSPPVPYTECEWVFSGPPGEILRIDFIDRFDLYHKNEDCEPEFLEIRDGPSNLSPLKGRYCTQQGTIKTSNNALYIKYSTQLNEPNDGFKANISIDTCGGTIISGTGEILSPGYPHMGIIRDSTVCEWRIIGPPRHAFKILPIDINLPDSVSPCGTKITIEEIISPNKTKAIVKTYCSDTVNSMLPIETSTNQINVVLHVSSLSHWEQISSYRGFKFTYNSSIPQCGGTITMSEGYLMTPSYPQETSLMYCQWMIKLPNKNRRVILELLDSDIERQKIGIYNDNQFLNLIQRIPSDNYSDTNRMFESSGSKLSIYVWLNRFIATAHRFKAKFSSDEEALCGGDLNGFTGELMSPNLNRSYSCEWHYINQMTDSGDLNYKTVFVTISANSSVTMQTRCMYMDPKLTIKSTLNNRGVKFSRDICGKTDVSYRIPSTAIDFKAIKSKTDEFYFHLTWNVQPCGGIIHVGEEPINILNIPSSFNETLECAWVLYIPGNSRIEIKTEGSFQLACDDQFIKITPSLDQYHPVIKRICKNEGEAPLLTYFKYMYIQYHSKPINNTDIKLTVKSITNECGGFLSGYRNVFASPNYPKNYSPSEECVWEIQADLGYRISLNFIERFAIEDSPNCTKDAVIIYDWNNDDYVEISRLCGRQTQPVYNSTYNRMKVILRADAETNLDGFKAKWSSICGGKYVATEKQQILYSPGYPYHYPSSKTCVYEISAANNKAFLKFKDFELEGPYPDCDSDNLTISAQNDYNYFYEVYCGSKIPPIITSYETVSLTFQTDRYLRRKGFSIIFSIYTCGGKVNESTVLSSQEKDAEDYDVNLNCTWLLEAPKSKIVVLKFLFIDLENLNGCDNDYIAVYEGLTVDYNNRLALMCGHVNSTTILRSKGNSLALEFVTDSSLNFKGFKVEVFFSYAESVGCGGQINVTTSNSYVLKSPLIGNNVVYDNYLDCHWLIRSPPDTKIKIAFSSFHISPCYNVNQTAIGKSKCDCDLVEINDGINPNSLVIGKYCGHTLPPQSISSDNLMGIRFHTDGELVSSGFEARISAEKSVCGLSMITLSDTPHKLKSPGYDTGVIPRSLHCVYHLDAPNMYTVVRITIVKLDLIDSVLEGNRKLCTRDRLFISSKQVVQNSSLGKDFIINSDADSFFENNFLFYDNIAQMPIQVEVCGRSESVDYYVLGSTTINLITSSESESNTHRGVEIEVALAGFCGRNYTERYGRIYSAYGESLNADENCYTLITAPENYTVSIYFMSTSPDYWDEECYLEIFDGNITTARQLIKVTSDYENLSVFSTGRYLLLHNRQHNYNRVTFDLNYVVTNKGVGCGGKLGNELGRITSPKYPHTYRRESRCEWEIETPVGTRVLLHFEAFDFGVGCDQNYLQLVDSKGVVYATYCSNDDPADYTSTDNYVKVVYVTSRNNDGRGWIIDFVGIV